MEKPDVRPKPDPEYRFWLYDPEGRGMLYYRTQEARDAAAKLAIDAYLDDGWDDGVEWVAAGVVTHFAQVLEKLVRPPDTDENGCDGEGTCWGDFEWRGNYTLALLTPNVQIEGQPASGLSRSNAGLEGNGRSDAC